MHTYILLCCIGVLETAPEYQHSYLLLDSKYENSFVYMFDFEYDDCPLCTSV